MTPDNAGDRLTIGITTILTIMFLSGAVNASMPPVSYAKAMDWYLMISFAFIFFSVIESLVVFVISSRPVHKGCNCEKKNIVSANANTSSNVPLLIDKIVVVVVVVYFCSL